MGRFAGSSMGRFCVTPCIRTYTKQWKALGWLWERGQTIADASFVRIPAGFRRGVRPTKKMGAEIYIWPTMGNYLDVASWSDGFWPFPPSPLPGND